MNTNGPAGSGPGYTIQRDKPRKNGAGTTGTIELSPGEELVAAIIANPMLLAVVTKVGLQAAHFEQGTGSRGAFGWAPKGAARIKQVLAMEYKGTTSEMLARLVDLEIFISEERAEALAREIIEARPSKGAADTENDAAAKAKRQTGGPRRNLDGNIAPHSWDDPDWSILDDRRGNLPDFPIDTLPAAYQAWLQRAAHGAGATPAHVAVPFLGITSSLIGTACRVMASRSWTQPMTNWTALVGFSGSSKTPGIDVTKRALSQIERNRRSKIAELRSAHEGRVEAAKAARALWKKEFERAAQGNVVSLKEYRDKVASEPVMPEAAADPGPFVAPRLYVSNVTIERLAVLLQARPQGMLMLSDELAGLFLNMSRYSGGQDNEFWLEAWNGNPYTVERMNRPPINVDHLLVGLVGGLQPDKLARSFKGDLDGMYARALFAWPVEPPYRPLTNEVAEVEPEIINALTRIIDITEGQDEFAPRNISLSPDAVEAFEQFRLFQHHTKEELDGREREWWAKAPAHVLRLAGTLSIISWAMVGGSLPDRIELEFVEAAIRLVRDYFWQHTRAALRQIGLNERHANARRLLRWVRARKKEEISLKDACREALGQSLDADQTQNLIEGLEKAGWLRKASTPTTGRTKHRWETNPKLFTFSSAESAESAESL